MQVSVIAAVFLAFSVALAGGLVGAVFYGLGAPVWAGVAVGVFAGAVLQGGRMYFGGHGVL
jgi:hypothetical protein